ncbi:MAG: TolC family protein [Flavobacteriales bacterium]|nr:TolC family protein [Flavobacteriales bacterium]
MKKTIFSTFIMMLYALGFSQEKLSLEQAYEFAVENNIDMQSARLDVINAQNKVYETRAMGLPQLNADVTYNNYLKQPVSMIPAEIAGGTPGTYVPVTFGTKQSMAAGATLSQLLFDGSYLVGLQSAKAYKKIAELAVEKTDESIKEAVYLTYSSILVLDENMNIIDNNIKVTEKNLNDVTKTYEVGLGEEQSVDQINYTLLSLKSNRTNLERDKVNLMHSLQFLIGKKEDEKIELTTTLDEVLMLKDKLVDESQFSSWENHIDVKIAENNKKTNELLLKYEKSKALPTLSASLSSTYNAYSGQFDFIDRQWFNSTLVGVNLKIPIFSGLGRTYRAQQAKIEIEKSQIELENTKQRLTKDANEQYNSYQNALGQLETAKKLQELSEKIYNKQRIKYFEGIGTSFDLTSAETQKYSADNTYFQAVSDVIQTKIKLEKTLGQL